MEEENDPEEEARQQALVQAMEKLRKSMKRHLRKSPLLQDWYVLLKRNAVLCRPPITMDDPNQKTISDFAS